MQSGREEEPFPTEEEEDKLSPVMEDGSILEQSILEQSNTLPELESERTKEQLAIYEAESTLRESTPCGEICEKSESLPFLLEGHAQVENVGCEFDENISFPHLEESHQRLWRDIRNFDILGTVEYEGDDEGDDYTKEIEPKKEEDIDETDFRKVSAPTSRKWLLVKLLLAGRKNFHLVSLSYSVLTKEILSDSKLRQNSEISSYTFASQAFLGVSGFCWPSIATSSYLLSAFLLRLDMYTHKIQIQTHFK